MSYRITIFNENGGVVSQTIYEEYPYDVQCKHNQWIDICRIPVSWLDHVDHEFEVDKNEDPYSEIELDYFLEMLE